MNETSATTVAYLGIKGLPFSGGAESVTEGIVTHLDPERFHAVIYCDSRIVPKDYHLPNVELIHVPSLPGKHLRATSHFISSAVHALLYGRYDLIHLHNAEASFVLPLLRLRYRHILATSHGQAQAHGKWGAFARKLISLMEYPFIRFPDVVTSVSKPLAKYYEERYGRDVYYVPNAVEEQPRIPEEIVEKTLDRHGLEPGYLMFAAGRVIPAKGAHTLLEAFRRLELPGARLIIVGDMKQIPAYEQELLELADERVTFVPFIADKIELMSLLQASRLFVFPSTNEAMSMMLLQAASFGKPVIFSDIPPNLAIMPETSTAFKAGDAADLHEKLLFALEHEAQVRATADRIQAHVRNEHSWGHIIEQYQGLYDKVSPVRARKEPI